jgi:hypothetical protein
MNNAKMWLVVKPTVGIPLFLSAVAIGSFAVHVAVLTNTSWVGDFLQGKPLGTRRSRIVPCLPEEGTAVGQCVLRRQSGSRRSGDHHPPARRHRDQGDHRAVGDAGLGHRTPRRADHAVVAKPAGAASAGSLSPKHIVTVSAILPAGSKDVRLSRIRSEEPGPDRAQVPSVRRRRLGEVPLSRLLRLSLFQVTVGMALVLLVGTLNRVMIVELAVPASLVSVMLALPLLFAPFRTLIGFRSDTHVSALGLRRVPYIWKGTMYQFGGFAIMPFALLVLSGYGEAIDAPRWIGLSSAALAFLLVGAGVHMVQTVGLALATDLVKEEDQPKVVGLMYVMLLFGMVVSALVFGALLENYTPGRLVR